MKTRILSHKDTQLLKDKKLLVEGEVAFKEGTVYYAENLLTKSRRILDVANLILEADRQILHG